MFTRQQASQIVRALQDANSTAEKSVKALERRMHAPPALEVPADLKGYSGPVELVSPSGAVMRFKSMSEMDTFRTTADPDIARLWFGTGHELESVSDSGPYRHKSMSAAAAPGL